MRLSKYVDGAIPKDAEDYLKFENAFPLAELTRFYFSRAMSR